MRVFTLGHARVFDALGLWEVKDHTQLALAVFLCSLNQSKIEAHLSSGTTALAAQFWFWRWHRKFRKEPELAKVKLEYLQRYIDEQTEAPGIRHRGETVPIKTPFLQVIRTLLISKLNYDPEKVWDTPYRTAMWDVRGLQEINGEAALIDGRDGEMDAEMKKAADEFAKQYFAGVKR